MSADRQKDTILIVYKHREIIEEISKALDDNEYNISDANSPIEALSQISFKTPTLIISENELDHDSGLDFCNKIRKSLKTKLIPFIIFSNKDKEEERIKSLENGADAYLARPINSKELRAHIHRKINHYNDFYLLSITDELTALYNRREFIKHFETLIAEDKERIISVAMLDIDYFKKVNDQHGHQTGDLVLIRFADLLKEKSGEHFFASRVGGEEFAIIMSDTKKEDAKKTIEELLGIFKSIPFTGKDNLNFHVSFSSGVAEYPATSRDISGLLSRADQALYSAKKDGRSRCYIFNYYMAHNDRFWEHFEQSSKFFINGDFNDALTSLPHLPKTLEKLITLNETINSIGYIVLNLNTVYDISEHYGIRSYEYAIQNIAHTIQSVCFSEYASDIYYSVSRFIGYGFTIFFPSLFDFTLNPKKCRVLYEEIIERIKNKTKEYPYEIEYSYGTAYYKSDDPKLIISDIAKSTKVMHTSSDKIKLFKSLSETKSDKIIKTIEKYYEVKKTHKTDSYAESYTLFTTKREENSFIEFDLFLKNNINSEDMLKEVLNYLLQELYGNTILIPYIDNFHIERFIEILSTLNKDNKNIILLFNEHYLKKNDESLLLSRPEPESKIQYGISNCYISTESLKITTLFDIKLILFSPYLFKHIEKEKERVKLIKGIVMFLNQLNVESVAMSIHSENEFSFVKGLNVGHFCGTFKYFQNNGNTAYI